MKKWKVMLSSNCQFTLAGLEYVISSDPNLSAKTDVITWPVSWLNHSECIKLGIDILILVVDQAVNHLMTQTNASLYRWKGMNVVLLTPLNCPEAVGNYLSEMMSVQAVHSVAVTVMALQQQLVNILEYGISNQRGNIMKLSPRELTVVNSLLRGKSARRIAWELGLSDKTVSHHKRTALMKLGASSLHGLMILGFHRDIRVPSNEKCQSIVR
jgi:two-component system capsular synthesis response regulator RcsB